MSTTLNDPTDQPRLLTESECKDLTRQMNFTMRRVEEIREYLPADSELTKYINKVCEDYKEKIRGRLKPYQEVMIQHTIFALNKLDRGNFYHLPSFFIISVFPGVLCVNVYNAVKSTPMEVIMRGLLNPADIRTVEESALAKAIRDAETFQRNVEFFCQVIRKGHTSTAEVKKHPGMKVLKDNFSEFQHAKSEYERVQEELEAEAAAAEEEEKERREKEMKMKKLRS